MIDEDTLFRIFETALVVGILALASFVVMGGIALMKWAGVF